jgi:hypothetical protein
MAWQQPSDLLEPNSVFPIENGFQVLITKDFPLIFRVLQNIVVCHAPEIKKRQEARGRHATELLKMSSEDLQCHDHKQKLYKLRKDPAKYFYIMTHVYLWIITSFPMPPIAYVKWNN